MYAIEVEHLNKSFAVGKEQVQVLKDLSFGVEKEDFLSIMGPSGCGNLRYYIFWVG